LLEGEIDEKNNPVHLARRDGGFQPSRKILSQRLRPATTKNIKSSRGPG